MKHFCCLLIFLCTTPAFAQTTRGAFVEGISNERSSFAVRVDVDRTDRVYAKDDLLHVTVESSEDGYLYLLYRDAAGNVVVLFPNRFQKDNFIPKNETVTVPAPGSNFRIRMDAPFGGELLKAVVTKKPLTHIDTTAFIGANATPVAEGTAKFFTQSFGKETPDWAEHQVWLQTVASRSGQPVSPDSGKRFAVVIGISDFKDNEIPNLGICHIDAEKTAEVFVQRCHVERDNMFLLTNENATLQNIRTTIRDDLPRLTKPGDVVFLFWSGHGGQTPDKKHEFLIPYDGTGRDIEGTMLMDETFGRWIQELDGRKVLVVLDACYSGGQANEAKTLSKSLDNAKTEWQPFRFAFTRLALTKDIGQRDTAVIASSSSKEVSYVRREKDLSVFTHYLVNSLAKAGNPLTHVQLCDIVKPLVADYVERNFAEQLQSYQTVVMQDDMTEPLVLNP